MTNLYELIHRRVEAAPQRVAIETLDGLALTYAELDLRCARLAARLARLGQPEHPCVRQPGQVAEDGHLAAVGRLATRAPEHVLPAGLRVDRGPGDRVPVAEVDGKVVFRKS